MKTACIFSDVHFKEHHHTAWGAFREWHKATKPHTTVALGDILDLSMFSAYSNSPDDPVYASEEIDYAVQELNSLRSECQRLVVLPGNHEERWYKTLFPKKAQSLKGLKGLSLKDQFYAQGLSKRIEWFQESAKTPGLVLGKDQVMVMHGHKQASRWGAKDIAGKLLSSFPTISTVVGHHHRAQLAWRTSLNHQVFAIANPHLSGDHEYNTTPDWQRGFTYLEFAGKLVTPYLVTMDPKGRFVYRGVVYG